MKISLLRLVFVASVLVNSNYSNAQEKLLLGGIASVIDGDTIKIQRKRIRLFGIDAPESSQLCEKNGERYPCGQQATATLSKKINNSRIQCEARDIDRYHRIVAVCYLGSLDLNAWMVRQGWAIAYRHYSTIYINDENAARSAQVGVWSGRYIKPTKWRRGIRLKSAKTSLNEARKCIIKGNISRSGKRIYHLPSGKYYEPTKINELRGEQWFCSEKDAQKAGWQRSKR